MTFYLNIGMSGLAGFMGIDVALTLRMIYDDLIVHSHLPHQCLAASNHPDNSVLEELLESWLGACIFEGGLVL